MKIALFIAASATLAVITGACTTHEQHVAALPQNAIVHCTVNDVKNVNSPNHSICRPY